MRVRCTTVLAPKLENKLNHYSLAANGSAVAAAIAGVFGLPQFAQAHPVYTPANQQLVGPYNLYQIDLNGDGIDDVNLTVIAYGNIGSGYVWNVGTMAAGGAQTGNEIVINQAGFAALGNRGQVIGPNDPFKSNAVMGSFFSEVGTGGFSTHRRGGPWFGVENRFLGVEFNINGHLHYGWLRISAFGPGSALLSGYAYETQPNIPITAGFKHFDDTTVAPVPRAPLPSKPQVHKVVPSSLGMLAVGAQGLNYWRIENNAVQPVGGK